MEATPLDRLSTPNMHQLGNDRGQGNLLGIEPYMVPQDYASRESFYHKLNNYLLAAQRAQWLSEKTIVVFPEYIGSWLVLVGEGERIYQATTFERAQQAMVFRQPLRFTARLLASHEKGRTEAAFFRMKAEQMAKMYHEIFSQLAQGYAVTLVAGSIVLPAPQLSKRRLLLSEGPLRNVSIVYRPDGSPYPNPVLKSFPTTKELTFIAPASANDLPVFDTPAGRLGVLICADSWFPQAYAALQKQDIELLAVPSFGAFATRTWDHTWPGYNGWTLPTDVDLKDVNKLTEGQAWNKYSLAGRIHSSGATRGINVFLRGKLWDQDSGGWPATLVRDGEVFVEEQTRQAAMLNLWL